MTGFCGWVARDEAHPGDTLDVMAAGLPPLGSDHSVSTGFGNVLCRQPGSAPALITIDNVTIAIDGFIEPIDGLDKPGERPFEALVAAFRKNGPDMLRDLSGEFAIAILDSERRELVIATDQLGSKPLAFAHVEGRGLVFGSTTEAVCRHPDIEPRINLQALMHYVYFHEVPSPQTIFNDVQKLMPGEYIAFSQGRMSRRTYWEPEFLEGEPRPEAEITSDLKAALRSAVRKRLTSGNVAGFLSGGLDSSTLVGIASEQVSGRFQAYTMGFEASGYDEMNYARIAARHFGADLHEYYVTQQDIIDAMPVIAAAYDEPFGNSSAVPTLMCARRAREDGVDVLLAGDGGDELFGGNERYARQGLFELYHRLPRFIRTGLIEPVAGLLPGVFPLGKVKSYVDQARVPMPERLDAYNILQRQSLDRIFSPEFLSGVDTGMPVRIQSDRYHSARADSLVNRMIWLDWKFTLADNDLRKVTRSCESSGIIATYPFLDQTLVRLSLQMTAKQKVRGQNLRYLFKKAMSDFLPREVIDKPKHGFGLPFGVWLAQSDQFQSFIYPLIDSLGRRGYFRPAFLDELIASSRSEHSAYYGNFVYVFAMLELWLSEHRVAE